LIVGDVVPGRKAGPNLLAQLAILVRISYQASEQAREQVCGYFTSSHDERGSVEDDLVLLEVESLLQLEDVEDEVLVLGGLVSQTLYDLLATERQMVASFLPDFVGDEIQVRGLPPVSCFCDATSHLLQSSDLDGLVEQRDPRVECTDIQASEVLTEGKISDNVKRINKVELFAGGRRPSGRSSQPAVEAPGKGSTDLTLIGSLCMGCRPSFLKP